MKPENQIIAHNIKLLRTIRKETQPEFGNRLGSNQKSIWSYEKGNVRPKPNFLLQISRHYGITPETMLHVKLKIDKGGKIINLPKADKEYGRLYKQLEIVMQKHAQQLELLQQETQEIFSKLGEYLKR